MTSSHDNPLPNTTDRRQFLKSAVLGASAATLGGLSLARGAHAAGSDVIRIGLVGCHGRGAGAAHQAMLTGPDVRLVAMADLFDDWLQASRKNLKNLLPEQVQVDDDHCFVGFDGYRRVIESSDVVLIACASKFHPMYSEAAVAAGKHVFVEKPHGIDPVGVRRMQAACDLAKEKGVSIVSGLQSRYDNGYRECVKRIHDGQIGKVVAIQSMFLRGPYRLEPREPGLTETQYQCRNWYHFCWLSGDDVTQSLVHNLDRVGWILGEETPKWAFALGGRSSSFGEVYGDMFDHSAVVYEYESGPRVYALCQTRHNCYGNPGDIIMGTKGTCDLFRNRIDGETKWRFRGPKNNPYQAEHDALFTSIREGKPINSGNHMATGTLVAVMGQIAAYSGGPVTWDEVSRSNLEFGPTPDEASFDTPPPVTPDATGNYPIPKPGITPLVV